MMSTIYIEQLKNMCNLYWCSLAATVGLRYHLASIATHTNIAIWAPDKHTAWSTYNAKHKTQPKGEKFIVENVLLFIM